jgi:hypothetical protein
MLTVNELREQAQRFLEAVDKESNTHLKRRLAGHALALAQLAETIERRERAEHKDDAA